VCLSVLPHLAVDLGTLAIFLEEVVVHAVEVSFFLIGCPVGVVVFVLDFLADGIFARREELCNGDARGIRLFCCAGCGCAAACLLLLAGLALLFLLGGAGAVGCVIRIFVVARGVGIGLCIVVLLVAGV